MRQMSGTGLFRFHCGFAHALKKRSLQLNPQSERLLMPDELFVRSTIATSFKNSSKVSFRQRAGSPSTSVHLCLPLPFVRFLLLGERAGVELGRPNGTQMVTSRALFATVRSWADSEQSQANPTVRKPPRSKCGQLVLDCRLAQIS